MVVVLWFKTPIVAMERPQYFHKATEVLTDAQGKFSIDASPGLNLNPFMFLLEEPWICDFQARLRALNGRLSERAAENARSA